MIFISTSYRGRYPKTSWPWWTLLCLHDQHFEPILLRSCHDIKLLDRAKMTDENTPPPADNSLKDKLASDCQPDLNCEIIIRSSWCRHPSWSGGICIRGQALAWSAWHSHPTGVSASSTSTAFVYTGFHLHRIQCNEWHLAYLKIARCWRYSSTSGVVIKHSLSVLQSFVSWVDMARAVCDAEPSRLHIHMRIIKTTYSPLLRPFSPPVQMHSVRDMWSNLQGSEH